MNIPSKKILVLSPFESWPLSQGSIVRTHFMATHLLKSNSIWFVFRKSAVTHTLPTQQDITNSRNRFAQLFNPFLFARLWRLVRREHISLIIVSQIWSGWHGVLLKLCTGRPLLFDDHNVEYLRLRRMGSIVWPLVALLEFIVCRAADAIVCVSDVDKGHLVKNLHVTDDKVTVLVNGANVNQLLKSPVPVDVIRAKLGLVAGERMVLFFGSLQHRPNAQAARIILQEIAPRLLRSNPEAKIVIAGLGRVSFLSKQRDDIPENVNFVGFVDDVTAVIKSADLVIVPLTAGSGTRYKIIESIACGRRVISTSIGAEGLQQHILGEALIICDDWDAFAQQIAENLTKEREVPPTPAFMQTYDWDVIWQNLPLPD
ncbi:MAG: glycosyltransferase family 4 protein [Chloroflexi bacterium]|nr:glycosyltransferase family 4 protein [Ardenticatenaceae bacterium]MBL1128971.1 glycosyltransferase [Chloroflexota bacterium]NOG35050.1 glycosyltransferase family 4 protein [Chloroflexota bacterium]